MSRLPRLFICGKPEIVLPHTCFPVSVRRIEKYEDSAVCGSKLVCKKFEVLEFLLSSVGSRVTVREATEY